MVILYEGKPLTEERKFDERDIYGSGFKYTVLNWFSSSIRIKEVRVKPDDGLVTKVTALGDEVTLKGSSINSDSICRRLQLLHRPNR